MTDDITRKRSAPASADAMIGQLLDERYRIEDVLGRGGMGAVFRGMHTLIERPVAIKMLLPEHIHNSDDEFLKRFRREAINTCKVDHPNAIIVHDFIVVDGVPYMIMEHLKGYTLSAYRKEHETLSLPEIYSIISQVGSALSKAHSVGIVHRDLKPDNIMIVDDGHGSPRVKVLDFGIAKLVGPESMPEGELTQKGIVIGTPAYMSPEQARAWPLDGRSDLYSLGIILYELLSGKPPFTEGTTMEILFKQAHEPPPPLQLGGQPPMVADEIRAVVARVLDKDPNKRFESAMEFIAALKTAVHGRSADAGGGQSAGASEPARYYSMDELLEILDTARRYFKVGDYLGSFEVLDKVVKNGVCDAKVIHLAVLSLARSGAVERAQDYFEQYKEHLPQSEEYRAVEARLLKGRFLQASGDAARAELGRRARDAYRSIYQDTQGFFPAINAATLSLLIGDNSEATRLAEETLQQCALAGSEDYWLHATRAEAYLILDRHEDAKRHLEVAATAAGADFASLSTTYRQLKLVCAARTVGEQAIAPIRPPAAIHYTGRMIDGIGSSPGIDPDDCADLEQGIGRILDEEGVGSAFGSLACGADIMVAEAVLARRGELTVVLPFSVEEFLDTSVRPSGEQWVNRFHRVLESAARVVFVPGDVCADHTLRYRTAASQAMGLAKLKADTLDSRIFQLAVYDGDSANAGAGTGADVQSWARMGLESRIVDVPAPRRQAAATVRIPVFEQTQAERELAAVVVGSLKGTDRVVESALPGINEAWSAQLSSLLSQGSETILFQTQWGHSVCLVTRETSDAADIADALLGFTFDHDGQQPASQIGMRVVIHAGLMFAAPGRLGQARTYFGSTIDTVTALDPNTSLDFIYVTEDFASHYATNPEPRFQCEYVGVHRHDVSKPQRLYRLTSH